MLGETATPIPASIVEPLFTVVSGTLVLLEPGTIDFFKVSAGWGAPFFIESCATTPAD